MNRTVFAPNGLLTDAEHQVIALLARAYVVYAETGVTGNDIREFAQSIHHAQHAVMAQAAARAYPDKYRLAEGTKP